jgi:hypothetical protein
MWTQIVGKIRLALSPPVNHWWHVTLYVTSRGLTTSPIPYGSRTFTIDFDFIDHHLLMTTSDGVMHTMALAPRSVADFYQECMALLHTLGIEVVIHAIPDEVEHPIPFADDHTHAAYDAAYAQRFWRILVQADRVLKMFRSRFIGKCSPVHFFWGAFDLAVTRFSGRQAPALPDADAVTREAASHEESSCGFWPGSGPIQAPAFYAYMLPTPAGLAHEPIRPNSAFWTPSCHNSSCCMRMYGRPSRQTTCCWSFSKARMKRVRRWRNGIVRRWREAPKGVSETSVTCCCIPQCRGILAQTRAQQRPHDCTRTLCLPR